MESSWGEWEEEEAEVPEVAERELRVARTHETALVLQKPRVAQKNEETGVLRKLPRVVHIWGKT